jgi:hypothetical protein
MEKSGIQEAPDPYQSSWSNARVVFLTIRDETFR